MSALERIPDLPQHDDALLRFMTCGSVDDGKSTLIGRLLYDTKAILGDTLSAITRTSKRKGLSAVDLSLLTDGLQAEREQGITIDVAYRYFLTGLRKYIIADAPGHEQYTRNMVTAASTANLAIILVDARRGVVTQTRRHSYLAHLVGIPHLVVAINKMDLVNYEQGVYDAICADYKKFAQTLGIRDVRFLPLSALDGDMVVERGGNLDWYDGPTLLQILESAPAAYCDADARMRFPVQYVCRPQASADATLHDFRGFMGRVESGTLMCGDEVEVLPSGARTRVERILVGVTELASATAEQSVTLVLADDLDISRGDLLVHPTNAPLLTRELTATICWLSDKPLQTGRKYLVRHTTREVRATFSELHECINLSSLEHLACSPICRNDIARVTLRLAAPLAVDFYAENRSTGAFIVIDPVSNNTVAAGMIE